jgi:hypothetical protein
MEGHFDSLKMSVEKETKEISKSIEDLVQMMKVAPKKTFFTNDKICPLDDQPIDVNIETL